MLGKLYKQEMKASGHYLAPLYIGAALATVLYAALWTMMKLWGNSIFSSVMMPLIVVLLIGILGAIYLGTELIMVIRFYRTMVSEEGYLTHTLPVRTSSLLLSKGYVALTWYVIAWAAMALVSGLALVLLLVASGVMVTTQWSSVANVLTSLFEQLKAHGFSLAAFCVEAVLVALISSMQKLFVVFLAIAIGQCMKSHKGMWAVGFWVCINILVGLVSQTCMTLVMLALGLHSTYSVWLGNYVGTYMHVTMWSTIGLSLVVLIVSYVLTRYLFAQHLNLE